MAVRQRVSLATEGILLADAKIFLAVARENESIQDLAAAQFSVLE